MRRTAILLFLLLPTLAPAQNSGVLIGLRDQYGGYRTLWVAPVAGMLAIAAARTRLVVPRADGFWQADQVLSCDITERMELQGPWLDEFRSVVWWRLGQPRPRVFERAARACNADNRKIEAEIKKHARQPADSTADDSQDAGGTCTTSDQVITFATARFVAYAMTDAQGENCAPGREVSSTRLSVVTSRKAPVSLLKTLNAKDSAALTARWEEQKGDCAFEESPDENWGIERGIGEWVVAFESTGATACAGSGGGNFTIHEPAPRSIVPQAPTDAWLALLRRQLPTVDDVFVSPSGDLVGARADRTLLFFTPAHGELGAPVLQLKLKDDEKIVMLEWALGPHVDRWTRLLK